MRFARYFALLILVGGAMLHSTAEAAVKSCSVATTWRSRADAEKDRIYVNQTDGVFLFEYTPDSDGTKLEGNPFYVSFPSKPNKKYRLDSIVRTGNGTSFKIRIDGAVDAQTSQPISFQLGQNASRTIGATIVAKANVVSLYVRGEHYIKFWSFVGPARLCEV